MHTTVQFCTVVVSFPDSSLRAGGGSVYETSMVDECILTDDSISSC